MLAQTVLARAINQGEALVSTISIAECLAHAASNKKSLDSLLDLMTCVPVTPDVAVRAGQIRAQYKHVRLPDAIHLATALESSARAFITNDEQLVKLRKIEKLEITPLA